MIGTTTFRPLNDDLRKLVSFHKLIEPDGPTRCQLKGCNPLNEADSKSIKVNNDSK